MFRRNKTAEAPAPAPGSTATRAGGKGRPTPSRRDAQAAAKARARGPQDKKEATRLQRQRRAEQNAKIREGMKTGNEQYLPARDKGPVKRFVRDWIDARLCMAELLLPVLLLTLLASSLFPTVINTVYSIALLVIALDTALLVFRLRRELTRRFEGRSTKGAVFYALLRSIQVRFLRQPKPQVKLGAKLPARY